MNRDNENEYTDYPSILPDLKRKPTDTADGYFDTSQNLSAFAGSIAEIIIDISRNRVRSLIQRTMQKLSPFETSCDNGVETVKGRKIVVWLVHPTNYRKDGTPRKWEKTILPSNAIGQLWALMPETIKDNDMEDVPIELHFLEDTVQPFDIDAIEASMQSEDTKGIVMLCGVQTNQWPRGIDLASLCRERNIPVVAGGYHVRAKLPLSEKQAKTMGIILADGEAEAVLEDGRPFVNAILQDLWNEDLNDTYSQSRNPDIYTEKISKVIPHYQKMMMNPFMATLETSRGCPLPCSFCTIRTIGGTEVRPRTAEDMKKWLCDITEIHKIDSIFITDDNFSRSDQRFETLKMLADLRKKGSGFNVMIQVDVMATAGSTGKRFVEECKRAGVQSVFLGIESVDPKTLKTMNKPQNRPDRYKEMIAVWHNANIVVQCGFIIGSPGETSGVGKRSAEMLLDMGIDLASPYIRTPLPGSVDYHLFYERGYIKETDFNKYDCHTAACLEFPDGLSGEKIMKEYESFYKIFFSWKNLPRLARRLRGESLKAAIRQWFWYKHTSDKGDHPMYSGYKELTPDYVRSYFRHNLIPSIVDLAPNPLSPGSPQQEKAPGKKNLPFLD